MTDTTEDITTDTAVTADGVNRDAGPGGSAGPAGSDPSATKGEDEANRTRSSGRGPGVSDSDEQPAGGRVRVTWRHALAAGLVCFAVWLVLDAPMLMRSAQDAPLGTRRTVAMTVLRPIADVSRALGLGHVVTGADRVIGHTGNTGSGVLQVEGVPAPPHRTVPARVPPPTAPAPTGKAGPTPGTGPGPGATTPVTAPDGLAPLAVPTPAAPLRLLVVGDSLGIDFGQPLVNDLAATDVVSAVLDGHIDTGLSRPDYFDWQTELQHDISRFQPAAIVVFIGANDPQNFMDGSTPLTYGTAAWNAAYAKRVATFMQTAAASGARVLWIGMPPMADPVLNGEMENLNDIDQSQAALHRGVTYFASWPVLSNAQGLYSAFLPNASGAEVQVRELDGTHLAPPGAQRLSQAAIAFMGHEWGLVL
jgi:lysophospholipase L1-like esterase